MCVLVCYDAWGGVRCVWKVWRESVCVLATYHSCVVCSPVYTDPSHPAPTHPLHPPFTHTHHNSAQLAEQANSVPSINSLDFVMESLALGHTIMSHR